MSRLTLRAPYCRNCGVRLVYGEPAIGASKGKVVGYVIAAVLVGIALPFLACFGLLAMISL